MVVEKKKKSSSGCLADALIDRPTFVLFPKTTERAGICQKHSLFLLLFRILLYSTLHSLPAPIIPIPPKMSNFDIPARPSNVGILGMEMYFPKRVSVATINLLLFCS